MNHTDVSPLWVSEQHKIHYIILFTIILLTYFGQWIMFIRSKQLLIIFNYQRNIAYHNNLKLILFPVVDVLSISKDVTPTSGVMYTCCSRMTICQQYQLNLERVYLKYTTQMRLRFYGAFLGSKISVQLQHKLSCQINDCLRPCLHGVGEPGLVG